MSIKVSDLYPTGSELFIDSESFLDDLTDADAMTVYGSEGYPIGEYLAYGIKTMEFGILGFAIQNIASLAIGFSAVGNGGGNGGNGGNGYGYGMD